jgi:hypothetical protein
VLAAALESLSVIEQDPAERRPRLLIGLGVIGFVLALGFWAATPFDDWVPLDRPSVLPDGVNDADLPASAHFTCSSMLVSDRASTATAQARSAVELQTLLRTPCDDARNERRALALVDLALVAAVVAAIALVTHRRDAQPEMPSGVVSSA